MSMSALSSEAVRAAALLRADFGIGPAEGLCPYDLAIRLQIKVSFISAPSLEGMYSPEPKPAIILNAERPAGRRRYTCAHEIGHHIFKHGFRIEELNEEKSSVWSPEEFLAQRFASALLMPKIAIDSAFARRGWSPANASESQCFIVAKELGVGFTTLITNMEVNLNAIPKTQAEGLRRKSIPKIRKSIAGQEVAGDVFQIDSHWMRPTIDVEVGDLIIIPVGGEIDGVCASPRLGCAEQLIATHAGIAKVKLGPGLETLSLRVSKKGFTGLARYRHLEETSDDV